MRHTKIIATIGPASNKDDVLDALIARGINIARLNFSHGTHASQGETFARIRAAAARAGREVAIMMDLGGPKIRTGTIKSGRPLSVKAGDPLTIVTGSDPGEPGRISTTFEALARGVRAGDRLLLDDGRVELCVEASDGREVRTTVVEGGDIGEHKGINCPGIELPTSAVTEKDADDLRFGLSLGVDMVAVSFVQRAADLEQARRIIVDAGAGDVPLVAKLERPQAIERLDEILGVCDVVMVARGDLGLELPLERVPTAQKMITHTARARGIPVIVATQVLESMTSEPRPTRAEVNDAANAVSDCVDAIMLSGETAAGLYPARAVQTLDAIIREAETVPVADEKRRGIGGGGDHAEALCEAAVTLAERGDADAIVAVTRGGGTAQKLSALRPRAPIIAASNREDTARRLAVYWGVLAVCTNIGENVDSAGVLIAQELLARKLIDRGQAVVFVNISPDLTRLDANFLKMHRL